MSDEARAYQERVTGQTSGEPYVVKDPAGAEVEFDGYDGKLVDAKGSGYARLLEDSGPGTSLYPRKGVLDELASQAQRQVAAAKGTPIEWRVSEQESADADQDRAVLGRADLADLLEQGRQLSDNGLPMPDLGRSVSLVSQPDSTASASLAATVEVRHDRVPFSVVVTPTFRVADPELWRGLLPAVLEVLVEVWSPQWAVAGTSSARAAQEDVLGIPGANLLTWVPGSAPPDLPDVVAVRPLAGGTLLDVRAGGDEAVVAVARALAAAGLHPGPQQPVA